MVRRQFRQHLLRSLRRINLLRNPRELCLILMQIGVRNLQQLRSGVSTISSYSSFFENVSAPIRKSPFDRGSRSVFTHCS